MTNSMNIKMPSLKLKVFAFLAITIVSGLFLSVGSAQAAAFNNLGNDLETLTLENRTTNPAATNPGSANWRDPITASGGDAISFRFYYHNTETGTVANNVRLRIAYPTTALTSIVTTGSILSNNAATVTNTGTINASSAQTITFDGTAMWYPDRTTTGGISIPVTNTGSYVEVNIGNVNGGWSTQGNVVFRATVSNTASPNSPVVNAGADVSVNEGQSVNLSGSATDPQGDNMTYSWSCTGGSLSNSNILNPVYTAPSVSSDTVFICTLTARDTAGNTGSDTVNVTVIDASALGSPVVNAGADVSVNEGQSVNLSGSATDPQGDNMTYSWSCTGGSLSNSNILNPVYTAPSVSITTVYVCTLTARDTSGNTGTDTVNITVTNIPGVNDPVVNAGADVSVNEGQSVNLSGSATDPQGDNMTYSWSCTGGSLSNSNILNPVYTAPSVSVTTTYVCTLTVRDVNGNIGSDVIIITIVDTGNNGGGGGGGNTGGGSPNVSVSLSASPAAGASPLNGVDLIATVYTSGISNQSLIIYKFDCEGDNAFELIAQTTSRTYVAQDVCNYFYDGLYTAKVKIEVDGYSDWNQVTIRAGYIPGGGTYGISVDAGSNKDISENQSTTLYGYGYSQYSNALSYYWTCNGGSLSNSVSLTPTYYTPSVDVDTTYACTLYVTDGRGYKNSDSVNIIVRNTGANYSSGLKVTTNYPDTINSTSAVLKGTLDSDAGQYTSLRFDWGKLSSYNNTTEWFTNKTSGQTLTYLLSGLEKGKTYHYKIEASSSKGVVMGQDVAFITKPDPTTGFSALAAGSGQISLSWNKGKTSCYTMVTRKVGGYPTSSADGTVVYYGTGTGVIDKNLSDNVWYYYRVWSVGCDEGLYSYSDSQYARAYTTGVSTGYIPPVQIVVENGISVEALSRDNTQNEIAWQNSITANPKDEIEFKIIVTPTGEKSLEDVVLKAVLSDKISSIKDIKVNEESYKGSLSEDIKLGTIALGESKIITFKGKINSRDNFSYGSNELINAIEISAKNNTTINKNITIDVLRGVESEAGLISLINLSTYAWILTLLFIILCIIVMYLLIERKKGKECLTEKAASTKVEKSKYFNIK